MNKFWNIAPTYDKSNILNMYVYGNIVSDSGFFGSADDVVTREFIKDLNNHPFAERINVYINSGGGEVFAAVAIAQQLKKCKAEVHTYVEGIAASAATLIAMAGDVRHMSLSGLYMIHLPSSNISGNKYDMSKGIEVLEKVEEIIKLTYKEKTNLSDEELTAMLEHEQWLTAEEAYAYNFITEIEQDTDVIDTKIKELQDNLISLNGVNIDVTAYAEPEKLRAKLTELKNKLKEGGTEMDFHSFMNSLPVEKRTLVEDTIKESVSTATTSLTEQVTTLTDQLANTTEQATSLQDTLTGVQEKLADAENKIKQLESVSSQEDADTTFLNSLPAEAKQAILDARKVAADAQAALNAANEEKAFTAFQDRVKAYDNLPLQDKHIQALYNMSKDCPEDFASIEALFNSANAAMQGQFTQLGKDADGDAPTDAYAEIEKCITDMRAENPTMDYNEAFSKVITENPSLYDRYRSGN